MSRCGVQARDWGGSRLLLTTTVALEQLGLEERPTRADHVLDVAVHHRREVVARQADAVVGQTVLREVVGADLLGALAGSHHALARGGALLLLALLLHIEEAAAQHLHGLAAILDLAL